MDFTPTFQLRNQDRKLLMDLSRVTVAGEWAELGFEPRRPLGLEGTFGYPVLVASLSTVGGNIWVLWTP